MSIKIGVGVGKGTSSFQAGKNAAEEALHKLNENRCDFVLVFSSSKFNLPELIRG